MQIIARKAVLPEVKGTCLKHCVHYLTGKPHRVAFNRTLTSRKPNVLDLIHSDVCGPMKVSTHNGACYFVTFIDDHSRKVWAYALKTKDVMLEAFKLF